MAPKNILYQQANIIDSLCKNHEVNMGGNCVSNIILLGKLIALYVTLAIYYKCLFVLEIGHHVKIKGSYQISKKKIYPIKIEQIYIFSLQHLVED